MKNIIACLLLILNLVSLNAQVEFRQIHSSEDMDMVWAASLSQNKPVFVDIYATWCGPCKWLDANVFATAAAGEYLNREFINVKLDGESEFGRVLAMKSGLSAYPSLFIFNSEQKLMNTLVGAKPWEELQPEIVSTLEYYPVLEVLQSKFESDLLPKEEYPRFTTVLRAMGKEDYGNLAADKYLKEFVIGDSITEKDIQVLAFYTTPQTDNWSKLVSDLPKLKNALGNTLGEFVEHSITMSIQFGVENGDINYIKGLASILPGLTQGTEMNPVEMETRLYVYYYHYSDLIDDMIAYIDSEYNTNRKGDDNWLYTAASDAVFLDPQNKPVAEKGLEWFQKCIAIKETQEYYYNLALCEYFTDSPDKTINSLTKSLEFTDDPEIIQTTKLIIEQVKQGMVEE